MTVDVQKLMARSFPNREHSYSKKDTMLYALGVGLGADPVDEKQLKFVYEENLRMLPTMPVILGYPGFWAKEPDTGINWRKLVHAEQSFVLHKPIKPEGTTIGANRISGIYDKGSEKGALLCQERNVLDKETGELLATVNQVTMLRGDGGCGGLPGSPPPPHAIPDREPDAVCDLSTIPQAALIYRLNGDYNPLHVDPAVAKAAGFERPILHGLCTMGVACHAVLRGLLDYNADRFKGMRVRFTAPVFPGDIIRTELWQDGDVVSFRSSVPARNKVVVLNAGRVDLQDGWS